MYTLRFVLVCFLCLFMNSGCGTIYGAVVDERDVTTIASDTKIKAKILKRLVDDETIKAWDVTVSSYHGHVYIVGEYDGLEQKKRCITLAKEVEGVRDVTTYLVQKEKSETCAAKDNMAVTLKVKTAMVGDKDIWSTNIDVKTIQCQTVVLWGLVGRKSEIEKAVQHAKEIEGVRKVHSLIRATQI